MRQFINDVIVRTTMIALIVEGIRRALLHCAIKMERKIPSETGLYTCRGPAILYDGSAKLKIRRPDDALSLREQYLKIF